MSPKPENQQTQDIDHSNVLENSPGIVRSFLTKLRGLRSSQNEEVENKFIPWKPSLFEEICNKYSIKPFEAALIILVSIGGPATAAWMVSDRTNVKSEVIEYRDADINIVSPDDGSIIPKESPGFR